MRRACCHAGARSTSGACSASWRLSARKSRAGCQPRRAKSCPTCPQTCASAGGYCPYTAGLISKYVSARAAKVGCCCKYHCPSATHCCTAFAGACCTKGLAARKKDEAAPAEVRANASPCSAHRQSCAAGSRCSRNGLTRTNAAALSALRQPHVASRSHQASQRANSASDSPARMAGMACKAHSATGADTAAKGASIGDRDSGQSGRRMGMASRGASCLQQVAFCRSRWGR